MKLSEKKNRSLFVVGANPGFIGKNPGPVKNENYPILAFYIIVKIKNC